MTKTNHVDAFVGARLREIRFQRGVSLNRLASRVSLTPARILAFENGEERIPARMMFELCSVLNVLPAEFFEVSKNGAAVSGCHKRAANAVGDMVPMTESAARRHGGETPPPDPRPYSARNPLSHKGLSIR